MAASDPPEPFYDLPPESFWVATADEQDWFNRNAVLQRKASLKLRRDFNSHSSHAVKKLSSTPSVFSFPVARSSKPVGLRSFNSRSDPGAEPGAVKDSEPDSPRVSCTGRIGFKGRGGKKTGFMRLLCFSFVAKKNGKTERRNEGAREPDGVACRSSGCQKGNRFGIHAN